MTDLPKKIAEFAAAHGMLPSEGLVLAAVSGGADSMCLLSSLTELSPAAGFSVAAMHFNHQLRSGESDADAAFVDKFCRDRGIRLYSGSGNVRSRSDMLGVGIEEAARSMRYDFFYKTAENAGAVRIATAHTADDDAETMLMNLTRGAGLRGLGGIPPVRGNVIRPMLTVTRREVLEYLSQRSVPFVEDSSNSLDIYRRNIIRHHVVPVLTKLNPRFVEAAAASAMLLREDENYLSGIAALYISDHSKDGTLNALDLTALSRAISSRIIRQLAAQQAAGQQTAEQLTARQVDDILKLCASDDPSGQLSLPGCTVYREYGRIVFSRGISDSGFKPAVLHIDGKARIPELGLTITCRRLASQNETEKKTASTEKINKSFTTFLFKYDNIYGNIVIRPRKTGDKIKLFGRNGSKTLKKLFIEKQIPAHSRAMIPVIADDIGVLAVWGIGYDSRAAINGTPDAEPGNTTLEITFEVTGNEE